jgi:hypothetical protein
MKGEESLLNPFISKDILQLIRKATECEIAMGMEPKANDGSVKCFLTHVFGDASYSNTR